VFSETYNNNKKIIDKTAFVRDVIIEDYEKKMIYVTNWIKKILT